MVKLYKLNLQGEWKLKRKIVLNNYIIWHCGGSAGITLKHKKNGKKIFLATEELFNDCKRNYLKEVENIGITYRYLLDENGKKIRNEKGKPIKIYTNKEEADLYKKYFLSMNYIQFGDFRILCDLFFSQRGNSFQVRS